METTLYDDNSSSPPDAKKRKVNMTLDLQQSNKTKQDKLNELLATPDVGMFMLTSPDLERFIIQQNGLVLTTPTPTTQILFPKSVTEEQEAYARGFVDALSELHKNYGPPAVSSTVAPSVVSSGAQKPAATTVVNLSTVTSLPTSLAVSAAQPSLLPVSVKAEPPRTTSTALPPPADIRPIDMDEQEMAKLERKRARNRQAATRCRNRKLERIARLEERVAELKGQNSQLQQSASALRDEVSRLKHAIIEHTRRGCQVMMTHNLLWAGESNVDEYRWADYWWRDCRFSPWTLCRAKSSVQQCCDIIGDTSCCQRKADEVQALYEVRWRNETVHMTVAKLVFYRTMFTNVWMCNHRFLANF